ncbi:hypothetical protein ACHAWF_007506 [Thalassiosira exigua]
MDYENDHLVYPNLVAAHIRTSNPETQSLKSLPPPPPSSSSVLRKVEESPAYRKPPPEKYDFEAEEEAMKWARERGEKGRSSGSSGGGAGGHGDESIEMDIGGVLKSGLTHCQGACSDALDKVKK